MEPKEIEKVRMLVCAWRVEHDKSTAILEELETILVGGVGIGDLLKHAENTFGLLWKGRYQSAYVWNYAKDRAQLKRLIKTLGPAEVDLRMARYIRNADPFFASKRHPFGLFVATVVQHAAPNDSPQASEDLELSAPVVDCRHMPPCASDRVHTKRRAAEMRGEAF